MKEEKSGQTSALYIWNGLYVFWGTAFHTLPHSHNTLQLVFDIEKTFRLKDEYTEWASFNAAIIAPNHIHSLDSNGGIQLFMYLDKTSKFARLLMDKYLNHKSINHLAFVKNSKFHRNFLQQLLVQTNCEQMFSGCISIIESLIDSLDQKPIDRRVQKALEIISQASLKNFRVKTIANQVHLSESRLRHLFKKEVGQSIQNFIMWMRVISSLNDVLKGEQLNQIALKRGYSDAPHMTKSFIEIIGLPPSKIKSYEVKTKIVACESNNRFAFNTAITSDWNNNRTIKNIKI